MIEADQNKEVKDMNPVVIIPALDPVYLQKFWTRGKLPVYHPPLYDWLVIRWRWFGSAIEIDQKTQEKPVREHIFKHSVLCTKSYRQCALSYVKFVNK